MVTQAVQALVSKSRYGVPAARPPCVETLTIAWGGQASVQAPQRVHAARKPISGSAPGGRKYFRLTTRSSVRAMRRSSQSPMAERNMSRRLVSPGFSMWFKYGGEAGRRGSGEARLKRLLEAEGPAKFYFSVTGLTVLGQFGTADKKREIETGGEARVTDLVIGPETETGVGDKPEWLAGEWLG